MNKKLEEIINNNRKYVQEGLVASYIPELAKANKDHLAVHIFDVNCNENYFGDVDVKFTIQSVSKVITLICALLDKGEDQVFEKVGTEPSSDAFNSIARLETRASHIPLNPFINAGAIVTTALINGDNGYEKFERVRNLIRKMADNDSIDVNYNVYNSEKLTGNTNRALAYYLKGAGIICDGVEDILDAYFKLCSLEVTARDIAKIASVLANKGVAPWSNERIIGVDHTRIVLAIMTTCGLYDSSGNFAVKVGMPSKSGVGGCIMSVAPKKMGVCVFGPALDQSGNSMAGKMVLEEVSKELDLSIF
ncbi:MAG: glutaminase A [Peptostreptococcaceae bacterium]|nr:glutaminase A [Peptostreptococcaceae bacterium]